MESMVFGSSASANIFHRLGKVAEIGQLNEAQLNEYERSLKALRDNYAVEKTAHDEGYKAGVAKGRAEGLYDAAVKMKNNGFDDTTIQNILNVRLSDIGL